MDIYFSDYFHVSQADLETYGAFNVSLINDLPLFIDPFLLFHSKKPEYQQLHQGIINYLVYLRDRSARNVLTKGALQAWYRFSEVKQNWLGFSKSGNGGRGLRDDFGKSLNRNLHLIFSNFGVEQITKSSHLEKLCLVSKGVGKDSISDFTTNLIKEYLLTYTQDFARKNIDPKLRKKIGVNRVRFNYDTHAWVSEYFDLPYYRNDYVILTPKDILTREDTWINRSDLYSDFLSVPYAIPNEQLREQINNYLRSILPKNPKKEDKETAIDSVIAKYPEILDYYIKNKEDHGNLAINDSQRKVIAAERLFIDQICELSDILTRTTDFYCKRGNTLQEATERVMFLKDVIENKDGYRLFYLDGKPIEREGDLQILYRLTWYATNSDVNREVNNGRGPVDFKISFGSHDKALVEFKLASNTQLERNLKHQVEVYEAANNTNKSLKVILYFSQSELSKVRKILNRTKLTDAKNIILIDARKDNKSSASKAK